MPFQIRPTSVEQKATLSLLSLAEAKKKIMDLMAHRDHSEKEIRTKLSQKCDANVLENALNWALTQNWFNSPDSLKENLAENLNRRNQGIKKINGKLIELGLTALPVNKDNEFEKAKKVVTSRWSKDDFKNLSAKDFQKLKTKILRFLVARGFEFDTISRIFENEFKIGALSYDEEF